MLIAGDEELGIAINGTFEELIIVWIISHYAKGALGSNDNC